MARSSQQLFDTLDIVFLGTIGLGTIAWFARHQIAEKLFKSSTTKPEAKTTEARAGPIKKERNFVKVMQQEVKRKKKKKKRVHLMLTLLYIYINRVVK